MKKRAGIIEQAGSILVTIGIVIIFANFSERPFAAAAFMVAGILIVITGGRMSGTLSWVSGSSLVSLLIAVILYFFTDSHTLYNLFLAISVLLLIGEFIRNKIRKKATHF